MSIYEIIYSICLFYIKEFLANSVFFIISGIIFVIATGSRFPHNEILTGCLLMTSVESLIFWLAPRKTFTQRKQIARLLQGKYF